MNFLRTIAWAVVKGLIHNQFPDVRSLSSRELAAWLTQTGNEKPVLLDARTPAEYAVSHLLGAHLALPDLKGWSPRVTPTTATPIVTYCSVGYRSARLAQQLQAAGHQNVFNLEGSIFEWVNQGHPVYRGEQAVKQLHPFNAFWGFLLNADGIQAQSSV